MLVYFEGAMIFRHPVTGPHKPSQQVFRTR